MDLPSRFLILISNEKMTTQITTRHQLPGGLCGPCQAPPPGTRTSENINHRVPAPAHLRDLIRHLSSLPAICKTVTYQECKTLKMSRSSLGSLCASLPGRGLEGHVHTPQALSCRKAPD